jgi:hypothetical protein
MTCHIPAIPDFFQGKSPEFAKVKEPGLENPVFKNYILSPSDGDQRR